MPTLFRRPLRHLALVALMTALAACGGGTATSGNAFSVGLLTDSPLQGVEYLTTSTSGTTTSAGAFNYKPGDTIVFRIGALSLGVVTGTGATMTVTPLQLIDGITLPAFRAAPENAVTNLLVLLQSLDGNGNAADGIQIPDAARLALQNQTFADTLFNLLPEDPTLFAASGELTTLVTAINTAGGSAVIVPPTNALAHFRSQFLADLAGSYYGNIGDALVGIRLRNDGSYLMASYLGNASGVERGVIDWAPASGIMSVPSINLDTDVSLGLSPLAGLTYPYRLSLDGSTLVMRMLDNQGVVLDTVRLSRLGDSATGLGGTWVQGARLSINDPNYLFLPNGQYMLMDPFSNICGDPGVELGSYQITSNGLLVFSDDLVDTDGCNGAHQAGGTGGYLTPALFIDPASGSMSWGWNSGIIQLLRPDNDAIATI